jgi:Holliday junction DNA helicase RuvB
MTDTTTATDEDVLEERTVRPTTLDDFTGQPELKHGLTLLLKAAKERDELPDHTLFYGPPGLGKTTLSEIMAADLGASIKKTSGPSLQRAGDVAAILTSMEGGVLFIDEIHRMPMAAEEVLYSAMEDFRIDILISEGGRKAISLPLQPFTLVGATTRLGDLSNPLRDRFGATFRLDYYDAQQLMAIGTRTADIMGFELNPNGALQLAMRSRGTPRVMNRLVRRSRDTAQVAGQKVIDEDTALSTTKSLGIDEFGLDEMDRRLLTTMARVYKGGPVGLKTLGAIISEPVSTVQDAIEPHLMRMELLMRTERGRMLTEKGFKYVRTLT